MPTASMVACTPLPLVLAQKCKWNAIPHLLICYSHPNAMPIPCNTQNTLSQEMLTMNAQSGTITWLRRIIVWVALRLRARRLSPWPPHPPLTGT